jgi:nucleoside-diphosphate-sugar epimerase
MTNNKVLVTGVPGWLGTRFVEFLVENNRDVRCFALEGMDTSYLEKELGVEVRIGDISDINTQIRLCRNIDTVFHLAGIIHPKRFTKELFEINTLGTANIIDNAIGENVERFVYVSSNSAQGCYNGIMDETGKMDSYMKYGQSKLIAENTVNSCSEENEIETVILRPCWFYGIRQPGRQTRLMRMIQDGKALLFGDGMNLRSMTYIDNLCDALLLAEKVKEANGETYWIADDKPYTTLKIYETIANLLDVELKYRTIPSICSDVARLMDKTIQSVGLYQTEIHVAGEMNQSIACSITKSKKELKYEPKVDLREGMRRSIEWAKENKLL